MLKIKAVFVIAFIVCSTNSIAYATADFPVATNDSNLSYESEDDNGSWEMDIQLGDALDLESTMRNQQKDLIYTVVKGDNLYRIAQAHNISLESLMSWNNLTSDLIHPGDELKIVGEEIDGLVVQKADPVKKDKVVAKGQNNSKRKITPPPSTLPPSTGGKEMIVTATAYTAYCEGCSGTTAYGIDLRANPNQKVIAVDPRVIPLGTRVWVEGYGEAIAGDTGGAIKGNKIDVFMPYHESAMAWGVKTVKIKVLN